MSWFFKRPGTPPRVRIAFDPQPDITTFMLARLLSYGWPVLVDSASGEGWTLPSFEVYQERWDQLAPELKRHFKVQE